MWDNARQLNAVALALTVLALTMLGWGGLSWLVRQPVFAFGRVVIDGTLARANAGHLEAVIREELKGTFFTLSLADARASLQRVPWVRTVALRRQWPNQLEVTVTEHQPLARWNDTALVNAQGEVFNADYNGELPQFNGPEGSAGEVTAHFYEFGVALQQAGLTLDAIRRSPRGGWQLKSGGQPSLTIELGRTDSSARLARFVAYHGRTVAALARVGTRIDYVDLRYRNGFAARVPEFKERPPKKTA